PSAISPYTQPFARPLTKSCNTSKTHSSHVPSRSYAGLITYLIAPRPKSKALLPVPRLGANKNLPVRLCQFLRHACHRLLKRHHRRYIGFPAPVREALLRLSDCLHLPFSRHLAHPFHEPETFDALAHEDHLAGLADDCLGRIEPAIDDPARAAAHGVEYLRSDRT